MNQLVGLDTQGCLDACNSMSDCDYFTNYFNPLDASTNECILFVDCVEFAEGTCTGGAPGSQCATGNKDCGTVECGTPGELIMH